MFPFWPVTLWGWWRTGGQGDRPHRGIHGGHHPQPVGRGGAPGRTCPPCVPGGPGARGPDRVGAERGQCPLRTQQTGLRGPAPGDACGSHVDMDLRGGREGCLPPFWTQWLRLAGCRCRASPPSPSGHHSAGHGPPTRLACVRGRALSAPASRPAWSLLGVRSPWARLGQVVPVPHPPWVSARLGARDSGQHVLGPLPAARWVTFEHRYQTVLESSREIQHCPVRCPQRPRVPAPGQEDQWEDFVLLSSPA